MSDLYINVDDVPGLLEFGTEYMGLGTWPPMHAEDFDSGREIRTGWWDQRRSGSYGPVVPLHVPAGRDLLVRWLLEGERCQLCADYLNGHPHCAACGGSGYARKPVPHAAVFRPHPEALHECVMRCARGEEPLRGVLDESVLAALATAYVRAHKVVTEWHGANPGQPMPWAVESYAHLMGDLQHRADQIAGRRVNMADLATEQP